MERGTDSGLRGKRRERVQGWKIGGKGRCKDKEKRGVKQKGEVWGVERR